jgi:hypothetical protein
MSPVFPRSGMRDISFAQKVELDGAPGLVQAAGNRDNVHPRPELPVPTRVVQEAFALRANAVGPSLAVDPMR